MDLKFSLPLLLLLLLVQRTLSSTTLIATHAYDCLYEVPYHTLVSPRTGYICQHGLDVPYFGTV